MRTRRRSIGYLVIGVGLTVLIAWLADRHVVKRQFIRSLSSNDMKARVDAAQKLLDMEKLEDALPAQPIIRRSKTAQALGKIGTEEAMRLLGVILRDQEDAPRRWARAALEEQEGRAIPTLLAALPAGGATTDEAIKALKAISRRREVGPRDIAAELRFFLSDGAALEGAATAVANVGDVGINALIRGCYNEDLDGLRVKSLTNLGLQRVEAAVGACLYNLKPLEESKKGEALTALGLIGDRRPVPDIIPFLRDKDNREAAVTALGQIRDPSAVEGILETLTLTDKRYRNAAVLALRRIGAPAFPSLVRELRSPEVLMRRGAAAALVGSNSPTVTGALGAALQDTDPEVRASAALALGWQNNLEGVASLVAALRDPHWRVVDSAVRALGEIGVSATGRLLGVLRDPAQDVTLRYQVARALAAMGRPAVNELVVALSEQNPDVQKWSAVALAEIGIAAPDVIGALEKLEQNSSGDLRWVASEQLRRLRRTTG